MRCTTAFPLVLLLAGFSAFPGCSVPAVRSDGPGPKVTPDEREWRRQSVPLPPLYMDFKSDSGNRWLMVTPLYWQVRGAEETHRHLVPLASYDSNPSARTSRGHVINYWWGRHPGGAYRVLFPVYWAFEDEESRTSFYGPLYARNETTGDRTRRLILLPWIFSRESDDTGYDYWGVLFRLFGHEKQVFDGEQRRRLWLFFVFKVPLP